MQTLVNTDFKQENQKDHKNGRSAKYIHAGKSPGKMSRQTDHPIQTHYFKFKFQIRSVCPSAKVLGFATITSPFKKFDPTLPTTFN